MRQRRQLEQRQQICFVFVRFALFCLFIYRFIFFSHSSLPSLHNYDVKWPKFYFNWQLERQGEKKFTVSYWLGRGALSSATNW